MFEWLNMYYIVCGRFKRCPETGRPYIKCNDCGVRIIEAVCDKTVEEWLKFMLEDGEEMRNRLIYEQGIGPEMAFSPSCLIQVKTIRIRPDRTAVPIDLNLLIHKCIFHRILLTETSVIPKNINYSILNFPTSERILYLLENYHTGNRIWG